MIPMEDPDDEQMQAFRDEAMNLQARWEASGLDDRLRRLGVYVDQIQIVPVPSPMGMSPGIAVLAQLGAVAFTDRVLDPEKDQIEDQFRVMALEENANSYLDLQAEIKRRLAAGESIEDLMSDPDDEDESPVTDD